MLRDMNRARILADPTALKDAENAADYLHTIPCLCGLEHIPLRRVHSSPGRLERGEGEESWPGLEVPQVVLHPSFWRIPTASTGATYDEMTSWQTDVNKWCVKMDNKITKQRRARERKARLLVKQFIEATSKRLEELAEDRRRQPALLQVSSQSGSPKKIQKICVTCHQQVPFTVRRDVVQVSDEEVAEVVQVSSDEEEKKDGEAPEVRREEAAEEVTSADVEELTAAMENSSIEDEDPEDPDPEARLVDLAVELQEESDELKARKEQWNYSRWG